MRDDPCEVVRPRPWRRESLTARPSRIPLGSRAIHAAFRLALRPHHGKFYGSLISTYTLAPEICSCLIETSARANTSPKATRATYILLTVAERIKPPLLFFLFSLFPFGKATFAERRPATSTTHQMRIIVEKPENYISIGIIILTSEEHIKIKYNLYSLSFCILQKISK